MIPPSILVVDDEPHSLFGICQILTDEGFRVFPAPNGKEALDKLRTESIDIVITDEKMPGLSGMDLLSEIKKTDEQIPVILVTAYGSVSMAVESLKRGAFYFFEKPLFNNLGQFFAIIRQSLKSREMEREISHLRKEVIEKYSFPNIVGNHPRMNEMFEIIAKVARTDKTILIQGESGTGKDLIAKTIHYNSRRAEKPLVTVNCGALTDNLLTSELFGHKKGAFTGAVKDAVGRFEAAHGGTLILDEISEVPLHLQKTLLRIIEEKEFERVGDSRSIKVDVRILATTNRILKEEVDRGNFREDLYYRLSIVPLTIPALRERISDIPLLVNYFLERFQQGKLSLRVEPAVLEGLKSHRWPGNVRELANVVQQMIIFCDQSCLTVNDLPLNLSDRKGVNDQAKTGRIDLTKLISDLEKKWIVGKLKEADWNQQKTARLLGITRKQLINRIKKYDVEKIRKRFPRI